jgi:Domain of unknown function (DUF3402)
MLELYTLKVLKSQVPYLGRKWRSSKYLFMKSDVSGTCYITVLTPSNVGNMRIITAIYLTCRPALREEWMTGLESESDIEESAVRVLPCFDTYF